MHRTTRASLYGVPVMPTRRKALLCLAVELTPTWVRAQGTDTQLQAPNIVEVSPRLVTSGQPTAASLAKLKAQGFGAR